MRRNMQFTPSVESLERLALLTTMPFEIAQFYSPMVQDTTDPSGDTAFAFPGMKFTFKVTTPASYRGLKHIDYTLSKPLLSTDSAKTIYTTSKGQVTFVTAAEWNPNDPSNYDIHDTDHSWACPKDPGTITITVTAEVWKYSNPYLPPTYDTLIDTLTLEVEAPTVTSFQVSSDAGAGVAASPMWFGQTDGTLAPSVSGTYMTFQMANGSPLAPGWVGFWATSVTNNTHYDLHIGTVQVVDASMRRAYTDGNSYGASGTDDLDNLPEWPSYWYQDQSRTYRYAKGTTGSFTASNLPSDAPYSAAPVSKGSGFLQTTSMYMQFDTHLVLAGGWYPNGPEVPGYPIALSTAQWHLDGEAVNNANQLNPGTASVATTTNMVNWTVGLASGSGPSPASLPGTNGPWTATGDGVRKYITYDGNLYTTLEPLNSSGGSVGAALSDSGAARGGPGAYNRWDRAVALLVPNLAPGEFSEPGRLADLVSQHRHKSHVPNRVAVALLLGTRSNRVFDPIRPPQWSFSRLTPLA